jgi:hypothetical protein
VVVVEENLHNIIIFPSYVDLEAGPKWKSWSNLVPSFKYNPEASFFQVLVPNEDVTRFSYAVDRLISNKAPCFLTGVSGVGEAERKSN